MEVDLTHSRLLLDRFSSLPALPDDPDDLQGVDHVLQNHLLAFHLMVNARLIELPRFVVALFVFLVPFNVALRGGRDAAREVGGLAAASFGFGVIETG